MKSKNLQNVVLSKYQNGDILTKICHDLSSAIGLRTIAKLVSSVYQVHIW